jgi:hypothetical protein
MTWASIRKPAYDAIVAQAPTPAGAVQLMIDFETGHGLTTPLVYVSTAITSGGFRRDPRYSDPATLGQAVLMNDAACARLLAVIAGEPAPFITVDNVMVPTELGTVPQWRDSHYLEFYFAWCAGLTGAAAEAYSQALASPELASIRTGADARDRTNAERWPAYAQFAKAATVEAALARRLLGSAARPPSRYLLQLIDVGYSLGCQAETIMARGLGWEILTIAAGSTLTGAARTDVRALRALGATVGTPSRPIEIVPVDLYI